MSCCDYYQDTLGSVTDESESRSAAVDIGVGPGAEGSPLIPLVHIAWASLLQNHSQTRLYCVSEKEWAGVEL